jgi:hypothetical protein
MNDLDLFLPYGAETTYEILDSAIYSQYNQTNSSALFRIGGDMYQYQLLRVVYPNNTWNAKPDDTGDFYDYSPLLIIDSGNVANNRKIKF